MRGLRKILGLPTTFNNRTCTKKGCSKRQPLLYILPLETNAKFSYSMNVIIKLMGHILRTSIDDPWRQVSFLPDSAHRLDYGKKRVGKPRQNRLYHTKKYVHEHVLNRHLFSEIDDDHWSRYLCSLSAEMLLPYWLRPRLVISWLFESEQGMARKKNYCYATICFLKIECCTSHSIFSYLYWSFIIPYNN